jgi:hypothetical protein
MSNHSVEGLKVAILAELMTQIEDGTKVVTKDGDVVVISAPASIISAGVNFLKTFPPEPVAAAPLEMSKTLEVYKKTMPFVEGGGPAREAEVTKGEALADDRDFAQLLLAS